MNTLFKGVAKDYDLLSFLNTSIIINEHNHPLLFFLLLIEVKKVPTGHAMLVMQIMNIIPLHFIVHLVILIYAKIV